MNSSLIDVVFLWDIFENSFRICFAVTALAGSFLALRLTTRLSLFKTIAAGLLIASVSWLLIAGFPLTLFVPLAISSALSEHKAFPIGWLIFPVLFSALTGTSIGLAVLKLFSQNVTRPAFLRLTAVNLLMLVLACYGVERMSRPPREMWDPDSGRFAWWSGQVTLPAGFTYHEEYGGDSFTGHFTSPDDKLTVSFDIGGYAGHFAHRKDAVFFEERTVESARVWVSRNCPANNLCRAAVTFPDSGSANFFVYGPRDADVGVIRSIARSFRPGAR